MRAVGLKILKNKLGEYVRMAAAGETVLITDRNRVVAEIVPPQPGHKAASHDEFIARGVQGGWLTPAKFRLALLFLRANPSCLSKN